MTREEQAVEVFKDMKSKSSFYGNHIIDACTVGIDAIEKLEKIKKIMEGSNDVI